MISDLLFDALIEIEKYQEKRQEMYDAYRPDIEECKTAMRTLLIKLDTIPTIKRQPDPAKVLVVGGLIAGGAYLLTRFAGGGDTQLQPDINKAV